MVSKPTRWRARYAIGLDGIPKPDPNGVYVLAREADEYITQSLLEPVRLLHMATIRFPHGLTDSMLADAKAWLKQTL